MVSIVSSSSLFVSLFLLLRAASANAQKCLPRSAISSAPPVPMYTTESITSMNSKVYSIVPMPPPASTPTPVYSMDTASVTSSPEDNPTTTSRITYYTFQVSYTPSTESTDTLIQTATSSYSTEPVTFTQQSSSTESNNIPPPPTGYTTYTESSNQYVYVTGSSPLAPNVPPAAY